jgi:hypothetical protein
MAKMKFVASGQQSARRSPSVNLDRSGAPRGPALRSALRARLRLRAASFPGLAAPRPHNRIVVELLDDDHVLEQPVEEQPARVRRPPVEAEDELVQIRLDVLRPNPAVVGAEQPPLHERGDTMHRRQDDVRRVVLRDRVGVVLKAPAGGLLEGTGYPSYFNFAYAFSRTSGAVFAEIALLTLRQHQVEPALGFVEQSRIILWGVVGEDRDCLRQSPPPCPLPGGVVRRQRLTKRVAAAGECSFQATIVSQAGSPTPIEPQSITPLMRPSRTSQLRTSRSPWCQTGGPSHGGAAIARSHSSVTALGPSNLKNQ